MDTRVHVVLVGFVCFCWFVGFVFVGDGLVVLLVGWLDWEVAIHAIS